MGRSSPPAAHDLDRRLPDRIATALRRYRRGGRTVRAARRILAVALFLAAAGFASVRPAAPAEGVRVLVAATDLDIGAALREGNLRTATVRAPPDGALAADAGSGGPAVGRVLAGPVRRGEILTDVRLVADSGPRAGPGRVAVPVTLDDSGVIDLLRPGMHVAVVAVGDDGAAAARTLTDDAVVLSVANRPDGAMSMSSSARVVVFAVHDAAADAVTAFGRRGLIALRFR